MATDTKTLKRFCAQISSPILLVQLRQRKILFANEAAERLLGYSETELFSKKIDSLFDSKYVQHIRAVFDLINDRPAKNLMIRESLVELIRKSGRRSQVNLCFSSQKNLLLINIEDMSDLIRLQREKEKLKEETHRISKMADIGRLAGGIAHELNNPLGTILGYVENIEFVIEDGSATPENIKENLEPIHLSVLRMGRVIAKLMAMFRQETSQRHAVSVQKIVEEVALLLEDSLESHSITLKRNVHDLWVKADADQLIQVLINICNNAINALEDTKFERTILIETSASAGKLMLHVANNGVEIPKSIQDKLFTPFFTTKDVGEGTGLGLYLCYNILKSHGGEITFSSSPTETRFSLHLPVMAELDIPRPAAEKLILVVEDDTFFRKVLAQKLTRLGYTCAEFHNGRSALEFFRESRKPVFAIFSDFKMPSMDGVQFFHQMRQLDANIPFVFLSGFASDANIVEVLRAHPNCRCISKPIVNSELKLVLSALDQEVAAKESNRSA